MRHIKKKGLLVGIFADLITISLSALANNNISNSTIRRLVLFCYSVRFELVCILILLLFLLIGIPLLRKLIKKDKYLVNTSICLVLALFSFSFALINLKRIVVDRKNYFENGYHLATVQFVPFKEANNYYSKGELERARETYNTVIELQANGYFSAAAKERIKDIDHLIDFRNNLYEEFDSKKTSFIRLTNYRGLSFLKSVFPGHYDYFYNQETAAIIDAISKYEQLYYAVETEDYDQMKTLIHDYGWCWFEQSLWDRFSSGSPEYILRSVRKYIEFESASDAKNRLYDKWNVKMED